jgi:phage I-like protein
MKRATMLNADPRRLAKLDAGESDAKWNQLFPLGERFRRDFPDGKVNFTADYFNTMLGNWTRAGKPALPVDFFHRGPSYEEGRNVDKVAAGWIEDLQLRDDGLWGLIKWTDDARDLILADKLRYLSPMFAHNAIDRKTGKLQGPTLAGAGLLNDPFLQDLPAVAASENVPSRGSSGKGSRDGVTVNYAAICKALGIDEAGDESAVLAALSAKLTRLGELETKSAKMTADLSRLTADGGEALKLATAKLETVTAEASKLADRVKALEKKEVDDGVSALCSKLESEGRIVAADKERVGKLVTALGLDEATKLTAAWPKVVPLKEAGVEVDVKLKAETPEEAFTKLNALARERAKAEKITVPAAKQAIYAEPEYQGLVAMANQGARSNEKQKN